MTLRPCIECGVPADGTYCPAHQPKPWAGSRRRVTVNGRAEQRRARRILRAYATICHVCHQPGADQVDHVTPLAEGGADNETNLRPIHATPCHQDKTAAEAARGRARAAEGVPGAPS